MFASFAKNLFGSSNDRIVKSMQPLVQQINDREANFASLDDDAPMFSFAHTLFRTCAFYRQNKGQRGIGNHENGNEMFLKNGRFGPYVKYGKAFVSLPKGVDPLSIELEDAIRFIKEKQKADAPIYHYQDLPVQKGKGRFGPFIKWNNTFINVNKKYDWDNLSKDDIVSLIEDKIQKEKDKLIHHWEAEGIRVEKARWGRHNIIKGKLKIELPKTVDAINLTLKEVEKIIEKKTPKPKKRATSKKK